MNKKKTKLFNSLTFYFTVAVFLVLIITMLILGTILYWCIEFGYLHNTTSSGLLFLFLGLALTSIVVGTLCSAILSKIPLQPFREIIESMEKVTKGDYRVHLDYESPEELKQFSQSFNLMVKELNNTEILRSDFINSFSHEFKTPIISIKGFTTLLRNKKLTEEQQNEYMDIILEESERLTELSTNVLNLTKLENTEILTGLEPCNIAEQIRKCLVLLENRWEKKEIEFDINFKEVIINAKVDLLQQVWLNLLDNAIKFSNEKGTIHLMLIESEQFVTFIIKDEGVGMNEDQTQNIFRKFYQTDQGKEKGGNGLGLSLAKRIVELHHGHIFVESKLNQGTSFTVSIPRNITSPQ